MTAPLRSGRLYVPADRVHASNASSPIWDFVPPSGVPYKPDVEASYRHLVPATGFLRQWIEWNHMRSDSPSIFHIGAWLSLLAALINPGYRTPFPGGTTHRPNLFTILVGDAATSRKSHAIREASKLLVKVARDRLGEDPRSPQGMLASLDPDADIKGIKIKLMIDEDFGGFLSASQRGLLLTVKQELLKGYDGAPLSSRLKNDKMFIPDYSLSILGAANPSQLEEFATPNDFAGGFFSRFLTLYVSKEKKERLLPGMSVRVPEDLEKAAETYFCQALALHRRHCWGGTVQIVPDSAHLLNTWESDLQERFAESPANVLPSLGRVSAMACRASSFYAFDRYISHNGTQSQNIQFDDMRHSVLLLEEHLAAILAVHVNVAQTPFLRKRRDVLKAIPDCNDFNHWAHLGKICKEARLSLREVKEVIETLEAEETIRKQTFNSKTVFQRTPVVPIIQAVSPLPIPSPDPSTTPLPTPPTPSYEPTEPIFYGDEDY